MTERHIVAGGLAIAALLAAGRWIGRLAPETRAAMIAADAPVRAIERERISASDAATAAEFYAENQDTQ